MKVATAIVKPDKLEEVARAVSAAGARRLTATEVRGFGQHYGHDGQDLPADARVLVLPKLQIDVTADELAWPVEQPSMARAKSA
jgi:nitrogen regulatory protein PII